MARQKAYVIITPVRDEGKYLKGIVSSVAGQTHRPRQWIIVDDGSTDETNRMLDAARAEHPWISVLHLPNRGVRRAGKGVVEAFNAGYRSITAHWDFLIKLDADLSFAPNYFERCLAKFNDAPMLGIGGGMICRTTPSSLVEEYLNEPRFHVRGATKIYRRNCWISLGGLVAAPGWDTLDEIKANMLGWETYTFRDIKAIHHRPSGEADGAWTNWWKNGFANYVAGYHPIFMLLKCGKRMFQRPFMVAAAGLFMGFVSGYVRQVPRAIPTDVLNYVRTQQIRRLTLRSSIWTYAASKP